MASGFVLDAVTSVIMVDLAAFARTAVAGHHFVTVAAEKFCRQNVLLLCFCMSGSFSVFLQTLLNFEEQLV